MKLSLGKIVKMQAVHYIFGGDEELLQFFFNHKGHNLKYSPKEMLRLAEEYSFNDSILIKVALSLMLSSDFVSFKEIMMIDDDQYFINILNGLLHMREIPTDLSYLC